MNNGWQRIVGKSGNGASTTWDEEKTAEVSGVLTEKRTNVGPNNSNMYIIEQDNGTLISVWGAAGLDLKMAEVEIGNEVKIVYLGKATNKKTNRTFKNFDVFFRASEGSSDANVGGKDDNDDIPF